MRETAGERGMEAGEVGLFLSPPPVCYGTCNAGNNIDVIQKKEAIKCYVLVYSKFL